MAQSTKTITYIHALSLAKMLGAVYGVIGLVAGVVASFVSLIGIGPSFTNNNMSFFGLVTGLGALVFLPIFYCVLGFVLGLIVGFVYNKLANRLGGIEITLE